MLGTWNSEYPPAGKPGAAELTYSDRVRPDASSDLTTRSGPVSAHSAVLSRSTGPRATTSPGKGAACNTGLSDIARSPPAEPVSATASAPTDTTPKARPTSQQSLLLRDRLTARTYSSESGGSRQGAAYASGIDRRKSVTRWTRPITPAAASRVPMGRYLAAVYWAIWRRSAPVTGRSGCGAPPWDMLFALVMLAGSRA
jgi:hypothetical protein